MAEWGSLEEEEKEDDVDGMVVWLVAAGR